FILVLTIIKVGASGVTMSVYLNKFTSEWTNIALSTSYALMGYVFIYQQNIMWLDGIVFLPLVIYGLDRILEDKKFLLYSFALFLSIYSNYYIGFMLCIFSFFYFSIHFLNNFIQQKIN